MLKKAYFVPESLATLLALALALVRQVMSSVWDNVLYAWNESHRRVKDKVWDSWDWKENIDKVSWYLLVTD